MEFRRVLFRSDAAHADPTTTKSLVEKKHFPFKVYCFEQTSNLLEGHLMSDHVHMLIAIPPKYAVSQVVGYIKGKSAIHLARVYGERRRDFVGQHFWARGYFVSTVGRDEEVIRRYIRDQEKEDERLDQLNLY